MLYEFGPWELDIDLYELRCSGQVVRLEPLVFDVLVYLVLNRDRVISKQELMSQVWPDQFIGDSALERCIMASRKAMGDSGSRQHVIKTFHRRGYRFIAPVMERALGVLSTSEALSESSSACLSPSHPSDATLSGIDVASGTSSTTREAESERDSVLVEERLPECQQTTVLSCSFVCSDVSYSREEMPALWDAFFARASDQVQRYGGLMAECMADSFLALFGATSPCDGHALRAVRTALELQEQLEDDCLKLELVPDALSARMGLHTGDIIGKQFGHEPNVMYMAVGNMMQFATNLQSCAEPGSVFLSSATHQLVQENVYAEVAGLVPVEAEDAPVAAYRLHRLRSQAVSRV